MVRPILPPQSPLSLFQQGLEHGEITGSDSARPFPPRLEAKGGLNPRQLAQNGRVYAATRVFTKAGSHVLALVDLEGGGRLLARLTSDEAAEALIGRAVWRAPEAGEPALTFVVGGAP